jgi:hypothetical protein
MHPMRPVNVKTGMKTYVCVQPKSAAIRFLFSEQLYLAEIVFRSSTATSGSSDHSQYSQ